eukprot:683542-Pelagomonas_calceolata.AAC.3
MLNFAFELWWRTQVQQLVSQMQELQDELTGELKRRRRAEQQLELQQQKAQAALDKQVVWSSNIAIRSISTQSMTIF